MGKQYANGSTVDFNEFSLKLPGFSVIPGITIPVIRFWDGQPLRYVHLCSRLRLCTTLI